MDSNLVWEGKIYGLVYLLLSENADLRDSKIGELNVFLFLRLRILGGDGLCMVLYVTRT